MTSDETSGTKFQGSEVGYLYLSGDAVPLVERIESK
jgi:hypothetical protein